MRLYTTTGATRVDDPVHGTFVVGDNDAFDFPNELSDRLHGVHVNRKAVWETDDERVTRVNEEQLKSVRDPAALYSAVREMSETQKGLSVGQNVLLAAVVKALGIDIPGVAPAAPAAVVPSAPTPVAPAVAPPVAVAPVAQPGVPAPTVKSAEAPPVEPVEASPKVERAEDAAIDVEPEAKETAAPAVVVPAETAVKPATAVKATRPRKNAASSSAPSA